MILKKQCLLIVLLLSASVSLFAQNAQELRLGTVVSGNINSGQEIWYNIRVTETSVLTVYTMGNNVDTYLEIYDDQRKLITENDDSGEDTNAKIEIVASAGKTYLVKLRGYDSDENGPFRILAVNSPMSAVVELNLGSAYSGDISRQGEYWFSVKAPGSGFVTVETTGSTDTYLYAYNSNYEQMASNDDGGGGSNARVEVFTETNRTYFFRLRGYDSDTSGAYRISAIFEKVEVPANTNRSGAVVLKLGEVVSIIFSAPSRSMWYVYELTRQATFVVYTDGSSDTVLCLYDSRGNLVAEDDDSGSETNAKISERLSPGTYYIEAKTFDGSRGRCALHTEIR